MSVASGFAVGVTSGSAVGISTVYGGGTVPVPSNSVANTAAGSIVAKKHIVNSRLSVRLHFVILSPPKLESISLLTENHLI